MRLSRVLPLSFGITDAALTLWDIHNQRVIAAVGMGWDTGAPLWPYQTPDTLLLALNVPAYVLAVPLERLLRLYTPWHYIVLFPAFFLWWWFAGLAIDSRLWRRERIRWEWWTVSAVLAMSFSIIGVFVLRDAFAWWAEYSRTAGTTKNIILLRASAPGMWALALGVAAAVLAKRRFPLSWR